MNQGCQKRDHVASHVRCWSGTAEQQDAKRAVVGAKHTNERRDQVKKLMMEEVTEGATRPLLGDPPASEQASQPTQSGHRQPTPQQPQPKQQQQQIPSESNPRQTDLTSTRTMAFAAHDLVEDVEDAMVAEEEMHDADTPETKRRRTLGRLDVSVSSNLVSVCAVYSARVRIGVGPSHG